MKMKIKLIAILLTSLTSATTLATNYIVKCDAIGDHSPKSKMNTSVERSFKIKQGKLLNYGAPTSGGRQIDIDVVSYSIHKEILIVNTYKRELSNAESYTREFIPLVDVNNSNEEFFVQYTQILNKKISNFMNYEITSCTFG
jgi:hypothetical protein